MKLVLPACLLLVTALNCGAQPFDVQAEWTMQLIVMISARMESAQTFGAGIVFGREKDRLFIATANHVVRRGAAEASDIRIRLRSAPGKALPAKLLQNVPGGLDLAVLEVEDLASNGVDTCGIPLDRLPAKATVARGDTVYPVGNPNGVPWSLPVRPDAVASVNGDELTFQSSLIAIGHSGGALLNATGQLVGMIRADEPPYGVAIGIAKVLEILKASNYPVHLRRQAPPGLLPLHGAVMRGDLEEVKELLQESCTDVNAAAGSKDRMQALYDAPSTGSMELSVARLYSVYTPLMLAALGKQPEIARLLIAHGALVDRRSGLGTALHVAAEGAATGVVEVLLASGANVNAIDFSRQTPLFLAVRHPEILPILLAAGADVNWKDGSGDTPLMRAVTFGMVQSVEALIKAGADVDAVNGSHETALAKATRSADPAIATILLRHVKALDPQVGRKLLGSAAEHGWSEMLRLLFAHGLTPNLELETYGGRTTPLAVAIDNAQVDAVKVLLESGADVERRVDGKTPLLRALEVPHIERHGSMVTSSSAHDPAVSLQLARLLVEHRANVNLPVEGNPERTPLYVALLEVDPPDFEVAKLLIQHGAVTRRNMLQMAETLHRPQVTEFLRKPRASQASPHRP